MKLIIDISEEDYRRGTVMASAIRNGKPFPKGHGRLIDADELEECTEIMNTISGESKYAVRMSDIRNMATLIEADKVESEDKNYDG